MDGFEPRVLPVGDGAVTVQLGASLDPETVGRVRALDVRIRDHPVEGIRETVPTYASLLVLYDKFLLTFRELRGRLLDLTRELGGSEVEGRFIEIPAVYDGEDLDEVARTCAVSRDEVVFLHASRDYQVLMLGFSPGFAYMGFVDERIQVPRRRTPRTRVPEGSIAIAGAQTGVYPRSLPGGWNLLGRTSENLFDSSLALPARLLPGDRVRFVPVQALPPIPSRVKPAWSGSGVRVLEPGILTTVQDGGRTGLRRLAVPLTGYADPASAAVANRCVGNGPDAPAIEICGGGLCLAFEKPTLVCLSGARITAVLERSDLPQPMLMPMNVAVRVRPSNVLSVSALDAGARGYIGIAGLNPPRELGSASVDLGSGFLGPLRAGDGLSVGRWDAERALRDAVVPPVRRETVRVILGPQADHFSEETIRAFLSQPWRVGLDSDRVGARLDGGRIIHAGPSEIVSDGMVPGCIQVPPDGRPIVMLSDCPTTGGYPKIACVVTEDLGLIAQAVPGNTAFRFVSVDM